MTYKNTKFEDSPLFRSLERLAVAKGLIKNDEIKKEAAAKPAPSLAPTKDLTQNILRLCSGLRAQGFMSYANDLESKFLTLKHAETIMDQAHPEGSVTLPDMEGDCTVEDQEDAHKMIEDIVKKTPKGKFGNDILNLCKIVLAQDAIPGADVNTGLTQPVIDYILSFFTNIDDSLKSFSNWFMGGASREAILALNRLKDTLIKHINNKTINMETIANINNLIDQAITEFSSRRLASIFVLSESIQDVLFQLKGLKIYMADTVIENHKSLITGAKPVPVLSPVETKANANKELVKKYTSLVLADMNMEKKDKMEAIAFLKERDSALDAQLAAFKSVPNNDPAKFLTNIDAIAARLAKFYTNWLA